MNVNGKYVEIKTSAHRTAPTKLWKIDYKHGVSNSIVVEADTEDEAAGIGIAEVRKNSSLNDSLCNWTKADVIDSVTCIKDFAVMQ